MQILAVRWIVITWVVSGTPQVVSAVTKWQAPADDSLGSVESVVTSIDQTDTFDYTTGSSSDLVTEGERGTSGSMAGVDHTRLALIGGTLVAGMVAIQIYQQSGWWKDNRAPFNFQEDLTYGLWVDKIGHFYGASAMTFVVSRAVEWANVPRRDALWMGAGASWIFQLYIEIQDGFSKWGFDRVDFAANTLGALHPVARYYFPVFENFDLKFSYRPSPNVHKPGHFAGQRHLMMDDYEGQTFWLAVRMKELLPQSVEAYWPEFLGLAVGYGGRDIVGANPHPVFFLGLDLDMTKVIPRNTRFLETLGDALNYIRLPLPAVRISPSTVWYGVYF